jgi:ABC-type sugar transport system ATPase subunit
MEPMDTGYILEMRNVSKSFSGNEVLHSVSFDLAAGEIHTLIGENGSGKSTLMKILMGIHPRDSGTIMLHGENVVFASPARALEHGIAMIHQELSPVLDMEISENIFAGREIRGASGFLVDIKKTREKTAELLERFGIELDPKTKMRNLSVGQCQLVEIIKAISCNAKIIIMDEPTSAITEDEVDLLFEQIKNLRSRGVSIIYISHKLEEIFRISDRITVLRDGECVGTGNISKFDTASLVKMMVGRELSEVFPKKHILAGESVLEVRELFYRNKVQNISFDLHEGEILGVAGLMGSGRSELAETIFGLRKKSAGQIKVRGKNVTIRHPRDAIKNGLALITEDRKQSGLNLRGSVGDNITVVFIKLLTKHGLLNRKNEERCAKDFSEKLHIKSAGINIPALSLSGGNQQKVVIAKWLVGSPDIIIMDEPTRGIDVGAKRDIYLLMGELVKAKKAVIMISSEMPELIGLCDRIMVLSEGRMVKIFSGPEYSPEEIMWCASGMEEHK